MDVSEGKNRNTNIYAKTLLACAILLFVLAVAIAVDISYGTTSIATGDIVSTVASKLGLGDAGGGVEKTDQIIIWEIRLPRAILAALVGTMLAMAGAALQGLLLNPLADPYTVGVSSGAALGAGAATLFGAGMLLGGYGITIAAFALALAAMFLVYFLARTAGGVSIHSFLLAGIVVGSFLWAMLSLVIALASSNPGDAQGKIINWLLGTFDAPDPWGFVGLALPFAVIGLVVLGVFARDLNIFSMGEETAKHLGLETEQLKIVIIATASLVTAAAVSVSGIIGFVGLVVPHICRKVFGPDHRILIPTSALAGGTLCVASDLASRAALPPGGLPVGVVTALIGAPFFLYLLKTARPR